MCLLIICTLALHREAETMNIPAQHANNQYLHGSHRFCDCPHKSQFQALEIYFKTHFGIDIDSLCKDLPRPMLRSFDPDIYCNHQSKVFEEMYVEKNFQRKPSREPQVVGETKVSHTDESVDVIERLIAVLEERQIDMTTSYQNWKRI
jgi:hypothetical protein